MLPLLVFAGGIPLKLATGTDLVHVIIVSATGMLIHRRNGFVDSRAGFFLGIAGIGGGFVGSYLSVHVSNRSLLLVYLLVVATAIILLFIPQKLDNRDYRKGEFNKSLGIVIGFGVGCLAGLLGVGGGFIIIPLITYLLKIPLRIAIGTSLLIILITTLGTVFAKYSVGHINLHATILVLSGSFIGALLGARTSLRSPVKLLRLIFLFTLVMIFFFVCYKTFL